MTVKEYIEASVRLSDEHIKAVERLKEKLEELLAGIEEQHKPAEPLIKDEKIRKAVRAWAELHELESVFYFTYTIHKELSYLKGKDIGAVIDIVALPELEEGEIYTIAELCGEEEE